MLPLSFVSPAEANPQTSPKTAPKISNTRMSFILPATPTYQRLLKKKRSLEQYLYPNSQFRKLSLNIRRIVIFVTIHFIFIVN
jgi:hypothetical protein